MSPDKAHYAKTEPSDQTYQVLYQNDPILESNQVLKLNEHYDGNDFPPVIYFPESALSKLTLSKTDFSTQCPIKGTASYWNYKDAENGIWSYETPSPEVSVIKGYFGFDQKKGFRVQLKETPLNQQV